MLGADLVHRDGHEQRLCAHHARCGSAGGHWLLQPLPAPELRQRQLQHHHCRCPSACIHLPNSTASVYQAGRECLKAGLLAWLTLAAPRRAGQLLAAAHLCASVPASLPACLVLTAKEPLPAKQRPSDLSVGMSESSLLIAAGWCLALPDSSTGVSLTHHSAEQGTLGQSPAAHCGSQPAATCSSPTPAGARPPTRCPARTARAAT